MSNIVTVRDIETVTAEIVTIHHHTQRMMLTGAIEIGRRLVEAKSMVPHGEWGRYLEERVSYSVSTANNLMKLYQEYGNNQASLFDNFANSQTFHNLTYTKALAMLALPADLRQTFAEENDVAAMSTREVQSAVQAELDAMKAENEKLEAALEDACDNNDILRQRLDEARQEAEGMKETVDGAEERIETARSAAAAALEKVSQLEKQLLEAKEKEKKAKAALKDAKEHPEIPEAMMEEMRQQVAADAAAKATEDLQKQLAAAKDEVATAEKARQEAEEAQQKTREQLAAAERAAKMRNPDVAVFQSLYIQLQETWNRCVGAYNKVKQADDGSAARCMKAMQAAITKFGSDLGG